MQNALMENPEAGDVIEGASGLRKLRHADPRRGKDMLKRELEARQ
ncbi:MAG: hypothetical protein Q8O25_00290 [Sulfurisoma sp.]|nr:hypothetical protein [Sulfurisoma sp.]